MNVEEKTELLVDFYTKNFDNMVNRLAKGAGGKQNAEDIVQEAFAIGLNKIDAYDSRRGKVSTWMNILLRNARGKFLQEERLQGMVRDSLEEEGAESIAPMKTLSMSTRKEIAKAIRKQPGDEQEVLRLFFGKGYDPKEIVELVPQGRRQVYYIVAKFKELMETKYARV